MIVSFYLIFFFTATISVKNDEHFENLMPRFGDPDMITEVLSEIEEENEETDELEDKNELYDPNGDLNLNYEDDGGEICLDHHGNLVREDQNPFENPDQEMYDTEKVRTTESDHEWNCRFYRFKYQTNRMGFPPFKDCVEDQDVKFHGMSSLDIGRDLMSKLFKKRKLKIVTQDGKEVKLNSIWTDSFIGHCVGRPRGFVQRHKNKNPYDKLQKWNPNKKSKFSPSTHRMIKTVGKGNSNNKL